MCWLPDDCWLACWCTAQAAGAGHWAPLTIDAYDNAANTYASRALRRVPVGGDLVQIIVQKQLLHHRHIPLYRAHPPAGQPPHAAVQGQLQELALLRPPPAVSAARLGALHEQQAEGNAVRYFYSPQGDGSNLQFAPPAAPGGAQQPLTPSPSRPSRGNGRVTVAQSGTLPLMGGE